MIFAPGGAGPRGLPSASPFQMPTRAIPAAPAGICDMHLGLHGGWNEVNGEGRACFGRSYEVLFFRLRREPPCFLLIRLVHLLGNEVPFITCTHAFNYPFAHRHDYQQITMTFSRAWLNALEQMPRSQVMDSIARGGLRNQMGFTREAWSPKGGNSRAISFNLF